MARQLLGSGAARLSQKNISGWTSYHEKAYLRGAFVKMPIERIL